MKIKNQIDLIQADKRLNLKEVSADEIIIMDVYDIWDGPLSGTCMFSDKEYFFFTFDQLEAELLESKNEAWPRKYILFQSDLGGGTSLNPIEITLKKEEIIGWFDSLKGNNDKNSRFLDSYFEWRKKTDVSAQGV